MRGFPPVPPLTDEELDAHQLSHDALDRALGSSDPRVRRAFARVQHRLLIEALSGIDVAAHLSGLTTPLASSTASPRRRFLSTELDARRRGVAAALNHIDTRLTMRTLGRLDHVIADETPFVLNAFAESHDPSGRETNAGSVRVGPVGFRDADSTFVPPDSIECGPLFAEAIHLARTVPAPPIIIAAWTALMTFSIHPFIDGNGRTARLLLHAHHCPHAGGGYDWGTIEVLGRSRTDYVQAIIRSVNPAGDGQIELVDPVPFVRFVVDCSIVGARTCAERLDRAGELLGVLDAEVGPEHAMVELFVAFERNVAVVELAELGGEHHEHVARAEDLVRVGRLVRDGRGRLNVGPASPLAVRVS
jgi:hypothetical protein